MSVAEPGCRRTWQDRFAAVRAHSRWLTQPLSVEDHQLQSMPDASPAKWHLAHTTWFFETLVLRPHAPGYQVFDPTYAYLFNSYYEALGPRHPRPQRGVLSRPSLDEVWAYRTHVDEAVARLARDADADTWAQVVGTLELGLHHEQQHQELILTDILHAFSLNPLGPVYRPAQEAGVLLGASHGARGGVDEPNGAAWLRLGGGLTHIGHEGEGFAFDNEQPRHAVWLRPFELAARPVTVREHLAFIEEGGYRDARWWLSDGWACVQAQGWEAPGYWRAASDGGEGWQVFGLHGWQALDLDAPVSHLSFYEADAHARWAGARLPTEFEWEAALNTVSSGSGQVWEWTASPYTAYPGFQPTPGAAAEYNGKFMVNQIVLRGGSRLSPPGHLRPTYRNFFPPATRWQCAGLRLARDAS
ncbi:ergothioneine biosynthesis protein EgtB [Aquabacterium soli]|uniref:Ergothioneine biosynthesis protein EgtB n=1 Tax=Aquabacterium soli TaxID=2493092 RepID=A0A3R8S3V2_9BURK|nr:ergothioneine biosynthesis protein EgtB [Aquabacterium soli]RRS04832.1 ergothioneine biosynthesis protein EgtB [Aquabacterium soli]